MENATRPITDGLPMMTMENVTRHITDGLPTMTMENVTGHVSETARFLDKVRLLVWRVVPPVLLVAGTAGNVLTLGVMRALRATTSSPGTQTLTLYFTALALSDQAVLLTCLVFSWVDRGFSWPPSFFRFHLFCLLPKFVWCASAVTSAWFLVAMTYQRVTAVVAPHRVNALCTARRGKTVVFVIVIVSCLLNAHFLFTWSYRPEEGQCQYRQTFAHVVDILEWSELVWASTIPSLLLCSGNAVLVWQVIRSVRLSGKIRVTAGGSDGQRGSSGSGSKVHPMTSTLVLTSTAFLLLTLPICIFDVCLQMTYTDFSEDDEDFRAWVRLGWTIALLLWIASCATNFYLYLLSGSKFRQEAKRVFVCCLSKGSTK